MPHETTAARKTAGPRFGEFKPGYAVEFQNERMIRSEKGIVADVNDLGATVRVNGNGETRILCRNDWFRILPAPGPEAAEAAERQEAQEALAEIAATVSATTPERRAAFIRRVAEVIREKQCSRLYALSVVTTWEFPDLVPFAASDNAAGQKLRDWAKRCGIELPKAPRRGMKAKAEPKESETYTAKSQTEPSGAPPPPESVPRAADKPDKKTRADRETASGCGARLRFLASRIRERMDAFLADAERVAAEAEAMGERIEAFAGLIGTEGDE